MKVLSLNFKNASCYSVCSTLYAGTVLPVYFKNYFDKYVLSHIFFFIPISCKWIPGSWKYQK